MAITAWRYLQEGEICCVTGIPRCSAYVLQIQGHMRVLKTRGARLSLRVHQRICVFLLRGRFWSSNCFLEGKCLVYWSHTHVMLGWGLSSHCLECRKVPCHKIEEIESVQYERRFLLLLPPYSCPSYPLAQPSLCKLQKIVQFCFIY